MKCLRWDARLAVGGRLKPFCTIMGNKEATAMHSRWALPAHCQNPLANNMRWFFGLFGAISSGWASLQWSIKELCPIAFVIKLNVLNCDKLTKFILRFIVDLFWRFIDWSLKWKRGFWIPARSKNYVLSSKTMSLQMTYDRRTACFQSLKLSIWEKISSFIVKLFHITGWESQYCISWAFFYILRGDR